MDNRIIMIDIPQDCYRCNFVTCWGRCGITGEIVDRSEWGGCPESCPINPMPRVKPRRWFWKMLSCWLSW